MKSNKSKILAIFLAVVMIVGALPTNVFAAIDYNPDGVVDDDYYKMVSKQDWTLAPGIEETEVVLNNAEGTKRQVVHSVKVDMNNPYTKVIPGYKGMIPTEGNYGTEATSTQAKNAEKLGYGNVVAATNAMLSWYNEAYYKQNPHLIGEPLYYNILDGYYYEESRGSSRFSSSNGVVVINYDYHPLTGEKRPDDMPKVLMRSQTDPLTGWEQNAISVWGWLVKPDENGVPKVTNAKNHTSGHESRTFVGVTAEGEIIISVSDGRQAPYSTGFNFYEMGEYMIEMGCIYAANCDGGGSTTFVSQRPGEELKVNCSLSDGGERPTTNTFLVISTAPADGEFAMATIDSAYDYYTPGSEVEFSVLATDAIGNKVDLPESAVWSIKEEGMGTIENGVFKSNGTEGQVTAQMIYEGNVVGECVINIASPDKLTFSQPIVTIPYGTKALIPVKATLNGLYEIGLSADDITFTSSDPSLGTVDGLYFVGAEKGVVSEGTKTHIVATLNSNPSVTAEVDIQLGEASVVMWDFEDGQADIDEWNSIVLRNPGEAHRDFYHKLSLADSTNGQVHNGNYSMRLETNGLSSADVHSQQYAYVRLGLKDQKISLENARALGFWLYVPEDNIQCWVQGFYKYDTNGDGTPDTLAEVNLMNSENVYYNVDESGWHYLQMDISEYENIDLTYSSPFDADPADGYKAGDQDEFFLVLIFHKSINNILWQTNGSINGPFTYYIDNITVDYSEVVEDREEPIFESVILDDKNGKQTLGKHDCGIATTNTLNMTANVSEATYRTDGTGTKHPLTNFTGLDVSSAKVYVDGVNVDCTYDNGKISINNVAVADGFHRVKFEICDNAGNKSTVVRLLEVKSGKVASTVTLKPADASLVTEDRLDFGSLFWMNLEATNIETIQEIETVIDLNSVNHWELDHMVLADGFSSSYTIDDETNTATITITRTGDNYQVGNATLAKLPIRIIYFDTDMNIPGYTAETVWTTYNFWPHDLKVDVDMGKITYVDRYTSDVIGTFSNEKFQVNTEMYTDFQKMSSDPYFLEHGGTHVHVPVAIDDKAPTCTQPGYTGRTFCELCNSIVEWGETVAATGAGHTYDTVDGIFQCTVCGDVLTGVYNGITYDNGVAISDGWNADHTSYYKNGAKVIGSHLIEGVMCTFDEKGLYLPEYIYDGFYEINDTLMYFVNNEYLVGAQRILGVNYNFDNNGYGYDGTYVFDSFTCQFENGVSVASANVKLAGIAGENTHFILTTSGEMNIIGEGDMDNGYTTTGLIPWFDYSDRSAIKKVIIDKDITSISQRAFINCPNLSEVIFEEGSKLKTIYRHAFNQCPALVSITLPDGVETLGAYSLGCSFQPEKLAQLKYVYLPASIKKIDALAFKGHHTDLVLAVEDGSFAHTYANNNGFNVEVKPYKPVVVASGTCGANVTWEYNDVGELVLSGSGAMTNYASKADVPWDAYRKQIKSITIGKDITSISDYAFGWCHNVESVSFEEGSVVEYIGRNAFHSFTKLTEITLPETVKKIGFSAFGYGTKLVSINIPSSVTYIHGDAFLNHATGLVLTVENGTYAHQFANNKNINVNVIPYKPKAIASGTCGENVTWTFNDIGGLVISGSGAMTNYASKTSVPWDAYRKQIKSITIGKDITSISDYAFGWCHYVESVSFEEGSIVEYIGRNAFHSFTKLTEITLPETVKTIGFSAFGYGTKLVSVNLSSTVTSINKDAFLNHATGLVLTVEAGTYAEKYAKAQGIAVNVLPYTPDVIANGTCGTYATWSINEIGELVIDGNGAMTNYASKTAVPWDAYRKQIKSITIGKGITSISDYAFGWCHYVEEVNFEEGSVVEYIGRNAFHSFTKLTEITLPETVKTIGFSAFGYGTKLVSINVPASATNIHADAFLNHNESLTLIVEEGSYAEEYAITKGIATDVK